MYAGVETKRFWLSMVMSVAGLGSLVVLSVASAFATSWFEPMVTVGLWDLPKTAAQSAGAMQTKPMGLAAAWALVRKFATSGSTEQSGPSMAKVLRFLAVPSPPGMMMASKSCGFADSIGLMLPLAMRAASVIWLRGGSFVGCSLMWSKMKRCGLSGARHW